jgi:SAM-dependent methyltransferase
MGVRERVGHELSAVGQRFGVDWLTYNRVILELYDDFAVADAPAVIGALRQAFPDAETALDVGAGSGAYAAEAARRGMSVTALERSAYGRRLARTRHGLAALPFDLGVMPPTPFSGTVDVAYCFEVAEHLPPRLGPSLVEFLDRHGERIVLTAAPPGQGGTGHVNERPADYWSGLFAELGREARDPRPFVSALPLAELSPHWASTSIMVF